MYPKNYLEILENTDSEPGDVQWRPELGPAKCPFGPFLLTSRNKDTRDGLTQQMAEPFQGHESLFGAASLDWETITGVPWSSVPDPHLGSSLKWKMEKRVPAADPPRNS